jgi:hypothetical protein
VNNKKDFSEELSQSSDSPSFISKPQNRPLRRQLRGREGWEGRKGYVPLISYTKGQIAFVYCYNYPVEGKILVEIDKKIGFVR